MPRQFKCSYLCECGADISWEASWEMLGASDDNEGIRVRLDHKTFDVFLGYAAFTDTHYLIIPSLGIGLEVDSYLDKSKIEGLICEKCRIDRRTAATISHAISSYFVG